MQRLPQLQARRAFPFRWILPIGQLVLCAFAMLPLQDRLGNDLAIVWHDFAGGYTMAHAAERPAQPDPPAPKDTATTPLAPSDLDPDKAQLQIPMALDLPALLVQLPYVLLNPRESVWRPRGLLLPDWNALFLPFAGLIFWYSAGRGLEALFAAARKEIDPYITWLETVCALVLFLTGIAVMSAVAFTSASEDHSFRAGAAGFALWCGLSVPVILAKLLQVKLAASLRF